jgi:hypothetical protein
MVLQRSCIPTCLFIESNYIPFYGGSQDFVDECVFNEGCVKTKCNAIYGLIDNREGTFLLFYTVFLCFYSRWRASFSSTFFRYPLFGFSVGRKLVLNNFHSHIFAIVCSSSNGVIAIHTSSVYILIIVKIMIRFIQVIITFFINLINCLALFNRKDFGIYICDNFPEIIFIY